ncbi:MAG: FHA domain-containing protein, partial [Gammaproteobacteria bacterium]
DGSTGALPGADGWHTVRRLPTTTSTQHAASVLRDAQPSARALSLLAAELARRLAAHPPLPKERVWIAAPAGAGRYGLGALLGVARQLALPVDGFVDAAVVSVATLGGTGPAIVIELGLHHAAATLVERDGGPTCRRRSLSSDHGGLLGLYQAWLDLINTAMVRQMRFDALHDASTEQQLFEALPELSREAMAGGVAVAALTAGGERIEVPLTRDQLIQAAQPLWREVARLLHELRPAGSALTLLVPRLVSALPGFRELLTQFTGCELVSLPAGFAAAATSLLDLPLRDAADPVRLLRRVPSESQPTLAALAALTARESAGEERAAAPTASHVLFDGRTFALAPEPLVVGRAPAAARAIVLPEGLAGVSRRHCTFLREGLDALLLDHSRFGTFVNGERVAERARVRAGDQVRIGDPGVALTLIAVADTPPGSRG